MDLVDVKRIIEHEIKKEIIVIKRFFGGMSNYTYLIEIDKELYTYRIPGKNSEYFIDRTVEKDNLSLIRKLNLNCTNVYLNVNNGHKMSKYIEGEDLSNNEVDFNEVALRLKLLHNSQIKAVNDYVKKDKLEYYESLLTIIHNEEYNILKSKLFQYLEKYKDVEFVFCHGDAQKSNWIVSENYFLLDWEYAANNDPYYDIACFGNVNFDDAKTLLKYYLGKEPNEYEMNRLILNRWFQCMQWYNVALYKEQIGLSKDLKVDFLAISKKYISLAKDFSDMIKM